MSPAQPLYQRLQNKPYPKHQQLDRVSLQWLYQRLHPGFVDVNSFVADYQPYPRAGYEVAVKLYTDVENERSIHGFGHGLRVSVYCWIIIQYLGIKNQLTEAQTKEIILAALFHDVGRLNDNADPRHGKRSADWIKKNLEGGVSAEVLTAVANHSLDQPENSSVQLKILQSADAVDRYRLPKSSWWPDYGRIPLEVSELDAFCRFITYNVEKILLELPNDEVAKVKVIQWLQQQGI